MNIAEMLKNPIIMAVVGLVAGLVIGLVVGILIGRARACGNKKPSSKKFKEMPPGMVEIYVGNLSYETTEDFLRKEFEKYGQVASIRIITNPISHRSKGFGFIEMSNRAEAEKAIAALDNAEIQGRRLHVNEARNNKN